MRGAILKLPTVAKLAHVNLPEQAREDLSKGDPRKGVTHNFVRSILPPGHKQLALIACGQNEYCAIGVVDKEVATSNYQDRVRCSFIQEILPISFKAILAAVPPRLKARLSRDFEQEIAAFTGPGGRAVLDAAMAIQPSLAGTIHDVLTHIEGKRSFRIQKDSPWTIVKQEMDAVDTALAIVGMAPTGLDSAILDPHHPAPVLQLMSRHALEDGQIEMDAGAFGGLTPIKADVRGAKVFDDPYAKSRVTVINVNRRDMEHTLGVDLIIYYSRFRSYLLVQYKRLLAKKTSGANCPTSSMAEQVRFYPSQDRNFAIALRKMTDVRLAVGVQVPQLAADYRLNDDPFYFKFCRADAIDPDSRGMVKGLYVPAMDVEHFLTSEESKGRGAGHSLGFDNLDRRFPNSLFVDLARTGWIGSRQMGSSQIEQYIQSALGSGRSVILANVQTGLSRQEGFHADEDLHHRPDESGETDPF